MPNPHEVIAAPYTLWLAAVGTAYPDIGEAPAAAWTKVGGTEGDKRYGEDGVSVSLPQTIQLWRPAGTTRPVKAFRTEEDVIISVMVHNMTAEQAAYVLNGNAVTDIAAVAGVGGYRRAALDRGLDVTQYAMLIRGPSAYDEALKCDWRVPRVVHTGSPEVVARKGEPAGLLFEFTAIEDPDYANGVFGEMLVQDAAAL